MTENPINPAALYDYAASKNDMDSLRPEERTFLEACAWEWERLIDHGAEEWGKQFEALGIKPGVPQAPSAKPTPAAPEKPAPSSPAAERADEGLEEEAERLREAYTNDEGSWLEWPDCRQEPWLRVARAARALRRGGVTEAMRTLCWIASHENRSVEDNRNMRHAAETVYAEIAALDSGASVVVDREEWERTKADLERLRAFYRSVNDEIPEGLWPAATTLDAFRKLVDGYANVCADAKALHEREEERDRALADTEHRHALAERERDALAAKLEEAERALCERAEQVDKLMQERDLVMARLGNFCQPGEIEDRIRILQGHAGKMERQRDEARADAERLRSERALIAKALDAEFSSEPLWSVAERLRGELDAERESHAETHDLAYEATRTAAPTVAVTDVEKAAKEINDRIHEEVNDWFKKIGFKGGGPGYWLGLQPVLSILRDCTRAASVEEVAKAIRDVTGRWQIDPRINTSLYIAQAEAVLRALGVREAEQKVQVEAPKVQVAPCRHERGSASVGPGGASSFKCHDCDYGYDLPAIREEPMAMNATPFVVDREKVAHGSWGDITRPDWIDVPFTQPFATPVLMVEAAEHLRSYAVSQERCARFWREKFKAAPSLGTQQAQAEGAPVTLNVPAKDPLDMTDADLDRICVALANVLPRFVRMKMPNIWPSDFAAEDQDGGKDYDEGFADGQESMRNRCIAALRAQGIEVIEDRKPTEQYRFSVDGKTYTHPSARISVPQILMYAHLTGDSSATPPIGPHTLYRVIDAFPDQQLRPDERVDLTLGQVTKFISVPPGIMGG